MKNAQILSFLFAVAVCTGCDKTDNQQDRQPDVYVAGVEIDHEQKKSFAVVWKNGKAQNLGEGEAYSVYVHGNDVYAAGWGLNAQGNQVAKLWKNGIGKELTKGVDKGNPYNYYSVSFFELRTSLHYYERDDIDRAAWPCDYASSVFVSGTDVYVALNEGAEAKIWKNEKVETLPNGNRATCVSVSGNDVYVAGSSESGITIATVWKNGKVYQTLTDKSNPDKWGRKDAIAKSIFVSGNDVYAIDLSVHNGRIWKNGVILYSLGDESNFANAKSIFVFGNDVYVCGREGITPKLWINGNQQTLSLETNYGVANSVYVSDKDVYVVGMEGEAFITQFENWDWAIVTQAWAKLWVNNVGKTLISEKTRIIPYSVFVVEK